MGLPVSFKYCSSISVRLVMIIASATKLGVFELPIWIFGEAPFDTPVWLPMVLLGPSNRVSKWLKLPFLPINVLELMERELFLRKENIVVVNRIQLNPKSRARTTA